MIIWIAQFSGVLGLAVMVRSLFKEQKKEMLFFVILNGLFFSIEYFFLGAFAGMFSNLFGIFRTMICSRKETDERVNKKVFLWGIMIIYLIIGIAGFDGWISLLPILASEIYVVSIWQSNITYIRYGTASMVVLWFIYDLIVAAYPSAVCDVIVFISTVISIYVSKTIPATKAAALERSS